jgi:isopentenyl diphosphate isomerase/L-lactate dehydrogenase-like FMN-dependent dehydrogenase
LFPQCALAGRRFAYFWKDEGIGTSGSGQAGARGVFLAPMDQHSRYPAISDLKARARRAFRISSGSIFDSATGSESVPPRNRTALDRVLFRPAALRGEITPDLGTTFLGRDYPVPFGIAPLGMSGLVWPDAETSAGAPRGGGGHSLWPVHGGHAHARGPRGAQGDQGWFQMYPPRDPGIRADMLSRARDAGFHTLILTVDVPAASRRERQTRGGLVQPPRLTPRLALQVARCPAWAMGIQRDRHATHAASGQLRRPGEDGPSCPRPPMWATCSAPRPTGITWRRSARAGTDPSSSRA